MGIRLINLLWYALAMFIPILYYTVITPNTNEGNFWVFVVVPLLWAIAGILSSSPSADRWKWIATSVALGLAEAALLYWA